MQKHELELANDYSLIGIHSSEEDYRLAFLLNMHLLTKFSKSKHDLDFKNRSDSFSIFEFEDDSNQLTNFLISNKFIGDATGSLETNLFSKKISYSNVSYLIPEKRKVDYFLKIEGDISDTELNKTIYKINNINQVITSYKINPSSLRSKDFLIF